MGKSFMLSKSKCLRESKLYLILDAQVNSHSAEQVMHGTFHKRVVDAVLDAMTDNEKLSLEVLDSEVKSRAFALVILSMLTGEFGKGLRG